MAHSPDKLILKKIRSNISAYIRRILHTEFNALAVNLTALIIVDRRF